MNVELLGNFHMFTQLLTEKKDADEGWRDVDGCLYKDHGFWLMFWVYPNPTSLLGCSSEHIHIGISRLLFYIPDFVGLWRDKLIGVH